MCFENNVWINHQGGYLGLFLVIYYTSTLLGYYKLKPYLRKVRKKFKKFFLKTKQDLPQEVP